MHKYIILKDNLERIFFTGKKLLLSKKIYKEGRELFLEKYEGFYSIKIVGIIRLFYISENSNVKRYRDLIDVTKNKLYKIENILKGSLITTNIIIEGADGTGKSTLTRELAQKGYLCQDRAIREVTQSMREYIPKEIRVYNVKMYLEEKKNSKLVILYLSKEEELKKRIFSREEISEYDKKALIFQRLYLDTYFSLQHYQNIFLLDGYNKTPEELVQSVIKLIKGY